MRLRSNSNGMQCPPPGRASVLRPASTRGFHLSGEFKTHCNDMVSVAERIWRLFSRKQIYHVHRNHKSMSMMSLNQDQAVYSINNNDFLTKDQELETKKKHLNSKFGNKLEVPLSIRYGSEPFLNKLPPEKRKFAHILPESNKRWSLDPTLRSETKSFSLETLDDISIQSESSERLKITPELEAEKDIFPILHTTLKRQDSISSFDDNVFNCSEEKGSGSSEKSPSVTPYLRKTATSRFSRDSSRCSVQILDSPNNSRWADAADRVMIGRSPEQPLNYYMAHSSTLKDGLHTSFTSFSVVLPKKQEQLGIHVIQSVDALTGQDRGLLIEEIEPDGRISKDQRIQLHDIIVNVNSQSLIGISFERAKEIFSNAMQESELCLHIVRNQSFPTTETSNYRNEFTKCEKTSSTPKIVSSFNMNSNIQQGNTRKIGKRMTVSLIKGHHGLGFSITTRDNHLGGEAIVCIKSILPKGSAIEDGNLRAGDRLLEINSVEVTGQSQADIVRMLRQIPHEGIALLTLSRQGADESTNKNQIPLNPPLIENNSTSDHLQGMPSDKSPEDSLTFPWKPRKILSFRIPVHNSEKDGLGIKVKGKTAKVDGYKDLGIFVKSIIEGGAASIDGQLQMNDQMININGMSLLEKSNNEAMKILYTAMNQNLEHEIFLTIARRFDGYDKSSVNTSGIISSEMGSPSSPVLTSTPVHTINKETSHKLSKKVSTLENFLDSEISNVSCDTTVIYDEQSCSDFEEHEMNNDCPGASNRSICDTTIISEDSNLSQASIEKSELGFSRDELWRQSMSEKRPATLDGKNTDTLQRNKKARGEREQQRVLEKENLLKDGNELQYLNPKRSSSVNEDLAKKNCFNSSNEHNKPFFFNSTEESIEKNKKSVIFNSLGSIFKFNKMNHRQTEKQEKINGSLTHNCNTYLNGQNETGVLY